MYATGHSSWYLASYAKRSQDKTIRMKDHVSGTLAPVPVEMAVRSSGLLLALPQIKQSHCMLNDVVSALLSLLGTDVLSLSALPLTDFCLAAGVCST